MSGAILPASFRTGTMTETVGGAPLADNSLMICPKSPRLGGWYLEWRELLMGR
jgi:hypothetical protein